MLISFINSSILDLKSNSNKKTFNSLWYENELLKQQQPLASFLRHSNNFKLYLKSCKVRPTANWMEYYCTSMNNCCMLPWRVLLLVVSLKFLEAPRFFLCSFYGETNFPYSKAEFTENVVISDRAYTILEIKSTKGYNMWTNELSPQKRICNQWHLSIKKT